MGSFGIRWALLALLAAAGIARSQAGAVITLDPSIRHQTMRDWEATAWAAQEDPAFSNFKNQLFDAAALDLKIRRLRLEIRSGAENTTDNWSRYRQGQISSATWRCLRYSTVNDNSDPFTINWSGFQWSELDHAVENVVLPMKQRVAAQGGQLRVLVNYVAFTSQMYGTGCPAGLQYVHDDSPEEYAEFVLATYLHLQQKYGWTPDAWEVILEPDNTSWWRGTQIGQAVAAAGARLRANGFTPAFVAPSTASMANAAPYFDALAAVPGAVANLVELSYHRYAGVSDSALQAIAQRGAARGIATAMLEHIGSGYEELHKDLKLGRASSWQQFTLVSLNGDGGGGYFVVNTSDSARPVLSFGSRTKYLRQYFRFVERGSVRIEASTTNTQFDPVAFLNPGGTFVVVVKAAAAGTFSIRGLPADTYGVSYTTDALYDASSADVPIRTGDTLQASMPGAGVMTVYGKAQPPPPPPPPPPSELVIDGGFENGGQSWQHSSYGGRSVTSSQYHSGSHSQEIQVSSQWPRQVFQDLAASAGETFDVSAWVMANGAGGGVRVKLIWLSATGLSGDPPPASVLHVDAVGALRGSASWTRFAGRYTAPQGTRALRLLLLTQVDPDNSGTAWFDDVQAVRASQPVRPAAAFRALNGAPVLLFYGSSQLLQPGGFFTSDAAVSQNAFGDVFLAGRNDSTRVWMNVFENDAGRWRGWTLAGDGKYGHPAVAAGPEGEACVVARDSASRYWLNRYRAESGFQSWIFLGGSFATDPVVAAARDGTVYVLGRDSTGAIWSGRYLPGSGFQGWVSGAGAGTPPFAGKPAIAIGSDGAAYVAARSAAANLWIARLEGDTWGPWFNGGGTLGSEPDVAASGGLIYAAVTSAWGVVYVRPFLEGATNGWQPWSCLDGILDKVSVAAVAGRYFLVGKNAPKDLWWYNSGGPGWTLGGFRGLAASNPAASPE